MPVLYQFPFVFRKNCQNWLSFHQFFNGAFWIDFHLEPHSEKGMAMQPTDPKETATKCPTEQFGSSEKVNLSEKQNPPKKGRQSPLIFMTAGIEFTGACAGLALIGWWLDGKYETAPWLMLVGLAMGLIGGTYKLYNTGKQFFK
jgi:F0F1-type ATP synthase assembly protein I